MKKPAFVVWSDKHERAALIGAYLGGSAANNDFNPLKWDYSSGRTWSGMLTGTVVGAVSAASWGFGVGALTGSAFGIPLGGLAKAAAWTVLGGKTINTLSTITSLISNFNNGMRILAGKYYTDENRTLGGQLWQGFSRVTWEGLQTWVGYNVSQIKNTIGEVDRVDYLGGATFVTNENARGGQGVSLGNYLNIDNPGRIDGNFRNYVLNDPLYMHEYGHTIDSRRFGFSYLFAIGIPSALGAAWTERKANRHAAGYFGRHYGVDWRRFEPPAFDYPLHR